MPPVPVRASCPQRGQPGHHRQHQAPASVPKCSAAWVQLIRSLPWARAVSEAAAASGTLVGLGLCLLNGISPWSIPQPAGTALMHGAAFTLGHTLSVLLVLQHICFSNRAPVVDHKALPQWPPCSGLTLCLLHSITSPLTSTTRTRRRWSCGRRMPRTATSGLQP